ncbi:MAG: hypothetical protein U0984_02120 [Prosthecobacter sp.]|nr:hypothetical protein [Prosthecobacter sp.]
MRHSLYTTKYLAMSTQQAALENLRVIRSLMEKAHIYRAISAPAALVGGLLAVMASGWGVWEYFEKGRALCASCFLWTWFIVLGITGILNVILLARDASRRGQAFVSEGMRTALRAILPPMFVGGVVGTGLIVYMNSFTMAALIWTLCYGLALLATASFSPRSLVRLGWFFVAGGLILFGVWATNGDIRMPATDGGPASIVLGLTFGLLHIGYAVAVFFSKKPETVAAE